MNTLKSLFLAGLLITASFPVIHSLSAEDLPPPPAPAVNTRMLIEALNRVTADSPSSEDIATLRAFGPAGLAALLDQLQYKPGNQNILAAIDAVAAQKDALDSRLFWYTDLAQAKAAAAKTQKPILYLRLLGKLTDEYSCANSRFFRTVLYPDPKVSAYLRENYILVWESERPVPLVTIDFGDGRILKRTLTGNSIHYVLDKDANVIDAMPGLYSPAAFLEALTLARTFQPKNAQAYHQTAIQTINAKWSPYLAAAQQQQEQPERAAVAAPREAARAMVNTRSKSGGEFRVLATVAPEYNRELAFASREANWQQWEAAANAFPVQLSTQSVSLMNRQIGKSSGLFLGNAIRAFERNIALETARNDYRFRTQIHQWLSETTYLKSVGIINSRVYSELFLTPASDPWLGLMDPNAYTGLTQQPPSQPLYQPAPPPQPTPQTASHTITTR